MTANGKIDRKALHLPAHERIEQRSSFVAPETPAERLVAEIIGQVLGTTHIGVHDDFFTLGGHSLLAAQVVARLRQVFQVDLPLRSLFEQPTVAGVMNELARIWGDQDTVEEIASVFHELDELSDAEIEQLLEH
jgi:acyl carrier protein